MNEDISSTTTLTILPCPLSLVHIPLSKINDLLHPILETWWYPPPPPRPASGSGSTTRFFSISRNRFELSIFAPTNEIQRNFGRYSHSSSSTSSSTASKGKGKAIDGGEDSVLISEETWIALEISIADQTGIEEAGRRIHSLTSPLAALSISILFLSTFSSDYILLRSRDLEVVIRVLEGEGFVVNEDDVDVEGGGFTEEPGEEGGEDELKRSIESIISTGGGEGHQPRMTRSFSMSLSRSSPSRSPNLSRRNSEKVSKPTTTKSTSLPPPSSSETLLNSTTTTKMRPPPRMSRLRRNENLVNVGLSLDSMHQEIWRKKLLQPLFFPDSLAVPSSSPRSSISTTSPEEGPSRGGEGDGKAGYYFSLVETCDSVSLTLDLDILRRLFSTEDGGGGGNGEEMVFVNGSGGLRGEWEGEREDEDEEESSFSQEESESEEASAMGCRREGLGTKEEEEGWENVIEDLRIRANPEPINTRDSAHDDISSVSSSASGRALLKTLQLDLLSLGLDASGLAHHYSALLIEGGIQNFMLQSTFGSANLLVCSKEAKRAQEVLLSSLLSSE
ncbi:ACT domain-containing protein [Sporobolomyces salmoneus]|uniref:ACT domain-containing protein n=1 Tax=Sporobolomyces salmoneus TaxID=183962 RepID=UPI00317A95CB